MMSKKITYDDLERLLLGIGFVRGQTEGNHKVYQHKPSDTLILLPPTQPKEIVDALHLAGVRRMVVNGGVIDDDDSFNRLLEDIESEALATS